MAEKTMQVDFGGQLYEFPQGTTDDEIAGALKQFTDNKPEPAPSSEQQDDDDAKALESNTRAQVHAVNFNDAVAYTLPKEGGYVKDPDDPGGETNFGISKRSFPGEDIKAMTKERATEIYKEHFWDKTKLGKLPREMGVKVFDAGVNIGAERGVRLLQELLGVTETGIVNEETTSALEAQDESKLLPKYAKRLEQYYKGVVKKRPKSKKFLPGWLNRAGELPTFATIDGE